MIRRDFLMAAMAPRVDSDPAYRIVTSYKPKAHWSVPGKVVRTHSADCINESSEEVDVEAVRRMMAEGMSRLTGDKDPRDSWRRFFDPTDVVGIKVNASGAPQIKSHPAVVAEIVRRLTESGVKPANIVIYERFPNQLVTIDYDRYNHTKIEQIGVEPFRGNLQEYDPKTYVDVNFFGEEDTRSFLIRMISERFTKIVNVPNMKDHGASGVTGCLKNMAYGSFNNVARSHAFSKTHTKTFIGTLASVEPVRSRFVLHVMDGLKGIWHGGPFQRDKRFAFYPKQMMFGTDPVAMDRILLDVIEEKRKAEGAVSVLDRNPEITKDVKPLDPNKNIFIREPGHIEYAGSLGLGVVDKAKIRLEEIRL